MKLLVTGGLGFIGSNFIHLWMKNNPDDQILNVDKLTYAGNLDNLVDIEDSLNYEFIKGNICDYELMSSLMKDVDVIVNFAAESHVDRSISSSEEFIKTNVEGTRCLLEAAKDNGNIRFHHVSTDEVFGHLEEGDPAFNEKTPYDPRSPYSASKAASDHLVRAYYYTHGLPITISNCSNNYGTCHFPEKLIPLFITNILEGKKVGVYGSGKQVRDWIHVDDHNRGVELILKKGKIGETYCLGGGGEMTNIDLTKRILELMGKGEDNIEYVEDRKGHDFRYAIDSSKIQKELAWKKEVNFEEGLKETIEWYKNNEWWWKPLKERLAKK